MFFTLAKDWPVIQEFLCSKKARLDFIKTQFCAVLRPIYWPAISKNCIKDLFANLQYDTLVGWADGTNDLSIKRLMFKVLFFFTKKKRKSFECPKSIINYEKWIVEHQTLGQWVVCPIGSANQHKLSDFYTDMENEGWISKLECPQPYLI